MAGQFVGLRKEAQPLQRLGRVIRSPIARQTRAEPLGHWPPHPGVRGPRWPPAARRSRAQLEEGREWGPARIASSAARGAPPPRVSRRCRRARCHEAVTARAVGGGGGGARSRPRPGDGRAFRPKAHRRLDVAAEEPGGRSQEVRGTSGPTGDDVAHALLGVEGHLEEDGPGPRQSWTHAIETGRARTREVVAEGTRFAPRRRQRPQALDGRGSASRRRARWRSARAPSSSAVTVRRGGERGRPMGPPPYRIGSDVRGVTSQTGGPEPPSYEIDRGEAVRSATAHRPPAQGGQIRRNAPLSSSMSDIGSCVLPSTSCPLMDTGSRASGLGVSSTPVEYEGATVVEAPGRHRYSARWPRTDPSRGGAVGGPSRDGLPHARRTTPSPPPYEADPQVARIARVPIDGPSIARGFEQTTLSRPALVTPTRDQQGSWRGRRPAEARRFSGDGLCGRAPRAFSALTRDVPG